MNKRLSILSMALVAVAMLGAALVWYRGREDLPEPGPSAKAMSQAESQEIRGYLDAENIDDAAQRCLRYPNPAEFNWDPRVVSAVCQLWRRKTVSYDEFRAAIEGHHPEQLDETFASYLERTYQADQHGFMVWAYRGMFENWSVEEGELLDKWVAEDPRSAFARAARGTHFVEVAFHERGADVADKTSPEQFARMRDYAARARTDLEQAARQDPRLIAAYHGLLRVAQLQSDRELFESARAAALALDPADQEIYQDLMDILQPKWAGSLGQMREVADKASAQADKNPLLALVPAEIPCYEAERLVCADCGHKSPLKQRARQALALYRAAAHDGPALCVLKYAPYSAEQSGDDVALARYYSQAFRFMGSNQRVIDRSLVLQRLGKPDWALEGLDRIIKAHPRAGNAFIHRGYVLMAEHRGREAQEAFANAYAIDPTNWDATRNLVNAYENLVHEPGKAREIVDRMMAQSPRNPRVWLLEASLHPAGDEAKCRDALKKYLELVDPRTSDAIDRYEIERATKRVAELDKQLGT